MVTRLRTTRPNVRRLASTKSSSASALLLGLVLVAGGLPASASLAASASQISSTTPLQKMADTERAFAARAKVVGWKQAFLEYFADSAIGFDGETAGPAKDQLRQVPDPPKDLQLLWEPRFGDISANGELGWLTGPSTSINP